MPKSEHPFEPGVLRVCWELGWAMDWGLVLWWQAGQHAQPGVSQLCWGPLVVAAIAPLVSYVMIFLVKGRHVVSAMRVLPMQLLNGLLFFLTLLLLTIGF